MNSRTQTGSTFVIFGISLICFMPSVTLIKTADADADSEHPMEASPINSQSDLNTFNVTNMKSNFSQIGNDKISLIRAAESRDNLHIGSEDISGKMIPKTKITTESRRFQGQIESVSGTRKPRKKFTGSQTKSRQHGRRRRQHRSKHANRKTASFATPSPSTPLRFNPTTQSKQSRWMAIRRGLWPWIRYSVAKPTRRQITPTNPSVIDETTERNINLTSMEVTQSYPASTNVTRGYHANVNVTQGYYTNVNVTQRHRNNATETHIYQNITNVTQIYQNNTNVTLGYENDTDVTQGYENNTDVTQGYQNNTDVTQGYQNNTNVTQGVPIRHTPSPPVPLEGMSLYGAKSEPDTPCPTCWMKKKTEEEVRSLRTAQFKTTMLQKFRRTENELSMKSMRGSVPKLPRDIWQKTLQDNAREESIEEFYAQDQEIIFQGQDLGRKCIKSRQVTGCYVFVLEGNIRREVASAQLWLYKTPDRHDFSGQTVRVFELEKASRGGRLRRRNLMVRQDTYVLDGWVTMNVTRSVRRWSDKNLRIAMVAIRCDTCRTRNYKALYGAKDGFRPLLVVDYDTSQEHLRKKRSESCDPSSGCCKRNLVIDFLQLGWGGVSNPPTVSIGYCYGHCSGNFNSYRYNHTLWRQNVRLNDPSIDASIRQQLRPCCTPLSFKDVSLLVYEEDDSGNGNFVRTTIPNVAVASCGCV